MLTKHFFENAILFLKAILTNQLARFVPELYVNLTHQTGRGQGEDDTFQVSNYFIQCFNEYREKLELSELEFANFLAEKIILEYGPGDVLGVALLMYAYGAKEINCVDKFPLSNLSEKNIQIYRNILNSLDKKHRERAATAFNENGKPESGFNQNVISYKITKNGLAGVSCKYDLIISRAVLEHVNSLGETMLDISQSLKSGGISIHQVDLKSHGLDRYKVFDFLTWPTPLYNLMYGHKGFPNRWRVNKYLELAKSSNLRIKNLTKTGQIKPDEIAALKLAKEFACIPVEQLSWLGFWMILEHAPIAVDHDELPL